MTYVRPYVNQVLKKHPLGKEFRIIRELILHHQEGRNAILSSLNNVIDYQGAYKGTYQGPYRNFYVNTFLRLIFSLFSSIKILIATIQLSGINLLFNKQPFIKT